MTMTDPIAVPAPTLTEFAVRTIDVKREYRMGTEVVQALKGVTVSINRGRIHFHHGPQRIGQIHLLQHDRRAR